MVVIVHRPIVMSSTGFRVKVGDNEVAFAAGDMRQVVDSSIVYPRRSTMLDKEIKQAREVMHLTYKCDNLSCSFDSALASVRESSELKGLGVKDVTEAALATIASNQELFPVRELDGFVIQTTGKPFLYVENTSDVKKPASDLRTGFMDLTEMRRRLFHVHERSKGTIPSLALSGLAGVALGALGTLVYVGRRLPR
jgi:hypothetical protein